ncbi:hypothetical protein [Methylomonas albis]|uniref:Uncharacterized protein n=1 Tax=Methylomonas albis TaxID=1854563 RepID=A0ABR9D2M4_9GAMM|nr:hypothetical protein [Methylomonas albis]MBD9357361.1 hypothetical protein [Methylomonas albis]CAD6880612.1 hypothetical protein [Methylomonas albis]
MSEQPGDLVNRAEEKKRCQSLIHLANLLLDRAIMSISSANADSVEESRKTRLVDRLSTEEIDILLSNILLEKDK